MNSLYVFSVGTALLILGVIFEMLRRRQLREKYALLWLVFAVAIIVLALWPGLLNGLAHALGVVDGVNLLLFGAVTVLLLVCLHLSWESSCLEDETRTLAEDIALLRLEVEQGRRDHPAAP